MKSWGPFINGFELVIIDFSNIYDFIPTASLDLEKVKHVQLSILKDAIQSAVLRYNGGVFLDADMILTDDLNPFFLQLDNYDTINFDHHLAFMMARRESLIIEEWHEEVMRRIDRLEPQESVAWDYFGNQILYPKFKSKKYNTLNLNKYKCAFTPEVNYYRNLGHVQRMYEKFWFSEKIGTDQVFYRDQAIIALHNSWTPGTYQNLSEDEILNHPSLLSRTLLSLKEKTESAPLREVGSIQWLMIKINWFIKAVLRRLGLIA